MAKDNVLGAACRQQHGAAAHLEELARPVAAVGDIAKVGEGPLRSAHLALDLGQLVAHGDQELAIALALVGGQRQDAGQVVPLLAALLLGEVPCAVGLPFSDDAPDEGMLVVV